MDVLPSEILAYILRLLKGSDRLRASFTCRRWLMLMSSSLPRSFRVCISLDASSCHAHLSFSLDSETTVGICICPEHVRAHAVLLSYLFGFVAPDIRSLVIDDDLIRHESDPEPMTDDVVHCILLEAPATINELILSGADLSQVKAWTFGLLAKFKCLTDFALFDCILPTCESLILRVLSPSYETLVSISITYSQQVTDKFASVVARRCPLIVRIDFTGCTQVSSLSLVAFCEADTYRTAEMLFIGLCGTSFNYNKLRSYLESPLMIGGMFWKLSTMKLQIGYPRNTVCLENTHQRNHLIVAFV